MSSTNLPILETTKKTYQNALFQYFSFLKRYWFLILIFMGATWLPILIEAIVDMSSFLKIVITEEGQQKTKLSGMEWFWIKYSLFFGSMFILFIISCWAPLALAVPWHQMLITNQSTTKLFYLGFNQPTWAYIWKIIQLWILSCAPFILVAVFYFITDHDLIADEDNFLLLLVILAYVLFIFSRFGITLPATAIGKPMTLRQSLALTSGHTISCLIILTLAIIPMFLLIYEPSNDILFSFIDPLFSEDDEWSIRDISLFSAIMLPFFTLIIFTSLLPLSALSHIYIALSNHPSHPS